MIAFLNTLTEVPNISRWSSGSFSDSHHSDIARLRHPIRNRGHICHEHASASQPADIQMTASESSLYAAVAAMPTQMFNKLQSDNNIATLVHNSSHAMVN